MVNDLVFREVNPEAAPLVLVAGSRSFSGSSEPLPFPLNLLARRTGQGGRGRIRFAGTFGYQLAFYQREGFRVVAIGKGFFLRNYPEPVWENGVQHKDMLRLRLQL